MTFRVPLCEAGEFISCATLVTPLPTHMPHCLTHVTASLNAQSRMRRWLSIGLRQVR